MPPSFDVTRLTVLEIKVLTSLIFLQLEDIPDRPKYQQGQTAHLVDINQSSTCLAQFESLSELN